MTFGINRVHGSLIAPKNFAGVALSDFTLTFWGGDLTAAWKDWNAGEGVADGALDQVFRTAVGTVASVSRVGVLNTSTGALRFAVEHLGVDQFSAGYLGMGPTNSSPASTAAALQAAVQALGSVTFVAPGTTASYTVHLSSATVQAFVY